MKPGLRSGLASALDFTFFFFLTGTSWTTGSPARAIKTFPPPSASEISFESVVFATPGKPSIITDFTRGDLVALGFPHLGPPGPLDRHAFHRRAEAQNADQKILYDANTGWLLYARKGSATHDPVAFAKVGMHLDHLGAGDFVVI